ncbi:AI-2E family transporter [Herbiconiux sp. KACC 21604]|uniref:AI-2E family transporter n=1 Tax=unclassified Herbiconiux TaxID=2618217 RepID=UPI001492B83B|nr:AI-2E family transporter [Herbiconiux sp. SALV-R1]QJU53983.1 AI-2E family transporter [Herbiconiux sp. SALV-R1]WPO85011.1 AI-2E family transporter [Herbiconiux sp. KACC 21604]
MSETGRPRRGLLKRLFSARAESAAEQGAPTPPPTSPRPASAPRAEPAPRVARPAPPVELASRTALDSVPMGMQIAGAWSWRILVLVGALAVFGFLIVQLRFLVIPLMLAVVLSALLVPFKNFLVRHHWPKWLAVTVAELSTLVVVAGLVFLVATQVSSGFDDLKNQTVASYNDLKAFLAQSPLQVSEDDFNSYVAQIWQTIQQDSQSLLSGAAAVGSSIGHVLAGVLLVLFSTLFILIDGERIWSWLVKLFPRKARAATDGAGRAGWRTLQNFVKVQILVASVDAVGIAVGAAILGVPLAIPIGVLVFLGSFIPIIGAVVTGAVAVFIALVYNGWVIALIMLGVVLLVQQLEGHVLQPFVMGTAVKVHPLAVVLAVAGGSMVAGIAGAFFAVPLVATLNVMIAYVAGGAWRASDRPALSTPPQKEPSPHD